MRRDCPDLAPFAPRRRPRALALTLAALALAVASPASADVRTEARRHFRRGMALVQAGQLDEGIAELQEAYDTLPHPNVLYNIARAYAEAGVYEPALEYFRRYLDSDPADREEVVGFVTAIEARQRAASAAATPAATPEPEVEPEVVETPAATEEEILAIEDSATQIATLAEASQSDALRQRADRLRTLAANLRSRAAASAAAPAAPEVAPAGERAAPAATPAAGSQAAEETGLDLAGESTEELYEEEVVSASRSAESPLDAPNSTTIVTAQDIRLSGVNNIVELLRRAAGVEIATMTPSHSELSIRGLNQRVSNKVLVLVDGRSVYLDMLGSTYTNTIAVNVEDIERIEIIRGPASALYGADAFTGIVNIITKEPGDGDSYVGAAFGNGEFARGVGSATGRTGRFAWRFSGGYEQEDQWEREITEARVDLRPFSHDSTQSYARAWLSADGRLRPGRRWQLDFGTHAYRGDTTIYGLSRLRQIWINDAFVAQTFAGVRSPVGLGLRVFWNAFLAEADQSDQPPAAIPIFTAMNQNVVDAELDYAAEFEAVVQHSFAIGVGYRYKSIDWSWIDGFKDEHHFAAYIQDRMVIAERLRLLLSGRLDQHPLLPDLQISPRGSLVFRTTDGSSVRLTGGTAFRAPAFLESYLEFENRTPVRGVTALGVGNETLAPESISSVELGYTNQESDSFALEANLYYNVIDDLIVLSAIDTFELQDYVMGNVDYLEDIGAFPIGQLRFANDGTAFRQVGGELGVRVFPVDGLDAYLNYAVHDTSPIEAQNDLGTRNEDQRTSAHKVNVGVQYRSPFGLDVSVDFHWLSDQVWAEQVTDTRTGVRFDAFALDGYALLNARLGFRLLDDTVELGVVGKNLLFQERRQHPFGQTMDTRVVGTAHVRF